jgi:hypothetical protein
MSADELLARVKEALHRLQALVADALVADALPPVRVGVLADCPPWCWRSGLEGPPGGNDWALRRWGAVQPQRADPTAAPLRSLAPGESHHCWCRTRLATARLEVRAEPGCAEHNLVQFHVQAGRPLPDLLAEWLALT